MTAPLPPLHLLLVEDDLDTAEELAELLELDAIAVQIAVTLADARSALARHRFDAVLIDLQVNEEPGSELAGELALQPAAGAAPRPLVIVLSGRGPTPAEHATIGQHVPLLLKPLRTDALHQLLEPLRQAGPTA